MGQGAALRRAALGLALGLGSPAHAADSAAGACSALVPAGDALQARLDAARAGATLCLAPGEHVGPLRIERAVSLVGPRAARVTSRGTGSTIEVTGAGARLRGFSVDGSGSRFERLDAAVHVHADDVRIEGLRIENALFGILAERSRGLALRGNEIVGNPGRALGLRGDAIRLWEVRDSEISRNRVADARDVVAWYSPDNRFERNTIARGRYGLHFMYSHRCELAGNLFDSDVVGVFVMYSRGLRILDNEIVHSAGAAGMGIGVKESGDLRIERNRLVDNTVGLYLDTSPLQPSEHNRIVGNLIAFQDRAVVFHGGAARNHFLANELRDNASQVSLDDRGSALAAEWRGNSFDDYQGYDLDGDGVGDLPYELRSLANDWTARAPALAFYRGTPALALLEWLGASVPLLRPTLILVDAEPRAPGRAGHAD